MTFVPHLLHVMPGFVPGGAQVRTVHLMNSFGKEFRHTIVALDHNTSASKLISGDVPVAYAECAKTSNPIAMISRLAALMGREKPDLVLTYNWGSIDAVAAAALVRGIPVVHTEDGFNDDEASQQKPRRILARRFLLRLATRVVAPSQRLITIMRQVWKLPESKVQHIPNGIDLQRFQPSPDNYRRRLSQPGEVVVGTVGHLRQEKRQGDLIQACATVIRRTQGRLALRLLIAGDGGERKKLEAMAAEAGIAPQVTFLGHCQEVDLLYREFDIFALSSATEQMPLSVLEAMASALPVLSTAVGDVPQMVSISNRDLVTSDPAIYANQLESLAFDGSRRVEIGKANRQHCEQHFSRERMLEQYRQLYLSAALHRRGNTSASRPPVEGRKVTERPL